MFSGVKDYFCPPVNIINYSIKISEDKQNETGIFRHPICKTSLIKSVKNQDTNQDYENLQEVLLSTCKQNKDKPFLGTIQPDSNIKYLTYTQILQLATDLGSGIQNLDLLYHAKNEYKNYEFQLIGVMANNCQEWVLLECSNLLYQNVMVPLYENSKVEIVEHILNQTQIKTIFTSIVALQTILEVENYSNLENIVVFEEIDQDLKDKINQKQLNLLFFDEILNNGKQDVSPIQQESQLNDVFSLSYTSGSTGIGKAVMLTHEMMLSSIVAIENSDFKLRQDDVAMSYLPLAHLFERLQLHTSLFYGLEYVFSSGDIKKFTDDLKIIRPTILPLVPRLVKRFYDKIHDKFLKQNKFKQMIINQAINRKLNNLRSNPSKLTHFLFDKLVFNEIKQAFGGRLRFAITGAAPLSSEVLDFMKIALSVPILEGYGLTETAGLATLTNILDPFSGHVGGPCTNIELKLLDIPPMNYYSKDDPPRGEICLRGPGCFSDYYKDIQKTTDTIDSEGWMHTGDVGTILPNGSLKIIDRVKNFFKLSQGEYVAPEKIENILMSAEGVQESFVYGNSEKDFLVAIVVPDKHWVMNFAAQNSLIKQLCYEELCQNKIVIDEILKKLDQVGEKLGLNSLEKVKRIYLEPESFVNKNICTNTMKILRFEAQKLYKNVFEQLYIE